MINNPFTQVLLNHIVAEITCLSDLLSSIVSNPPDIQLREYAYSICKVLASEFMGQVTDRFLQSLGGRGYEEPNIAARFFRDARVDRIYEGPIEVLLMNLWLYAENKFSLFEKYFRKIAQLGSSVDELMCTKRKFIRTIQQSYTHFNEQQKKNLYYYLFGKAITYCYLYAIQLTKKTDDSLSHFCKN